MEALEALEVMERIEMPQRQICRDRTNPFETYTDEEFKRRFRFEKRTVELLLELISSDLEHSSAKNNVIPPVLQLSVALRFYAIGHFQTTDGDLIGISQPSVCRIIERVSLSIASRGNISSHFHQGLKHLI